MSNAPPAQRPPAAPVYASSIDDPIYDALSEDGGGYRLTVEGCAQSAAARFLCVREPGQVGGAAGIDLDPDRARRIAARLVEWAEEVEWAEAQEAAQ